MQETVQDIEKKHSKKKKKKNQFNSSSFMSTESLLNLHKIFNTTDKEVTVCVSDHSKCLKYNNIKSIQVLLTWLFSSKAHNPMWLSIKNMSKISHCIFISTEIEQNLFYQLLNSQQLKFINSIFNVEAKAEFKESPLHKNIWQKLFSSEMKMVKGTPSIHQIDQNLTLEQKIYRQYSKYMLTEEQLRDNLYPNERFPIFKEYIKIVNAAPESYPISNKILAMDCEMVRTCVGLELAKVTIVNLEFEIVYDKLVKPVNTILDYNTQYSGITEEILKQVATTLKQVQDDLKQIIFTDSILIGHSLENDLNALQILHTNIIDTSVLYYSEYGKKMQLKVLAQNHLKNRIQENNHDSVEDCTNTLGLARLKIQIISKINPSIYVPAYDVLRLLSESNKILLTDSIQEIQQSEISMDNVSIVVSESIDAKVDTLIKNQDNKLFFTSLRYTQKQSMDWKQYYIRVDQHLRIIYDQAPTNTLFMFNFEINKEVLMQPQGRQSMQIRPYCLFATK